MHCPQSFLTLLSLCFFSPSLVRADDTTTTVPIYLPHYDANSWSQLRGSVISSNAKETTYTIFCAPQTPPNCDLAVEFPFVFAEGENTLQFHGTKNINIVGAPTRRCLQDVPVTKHDVTGNSIADLECTLSGTTAATCSGYSSLKSGYVNGKYTGPTEVSWTSTMTGSEVQWGVLTLAEEDAAATTEPTPAPGDPNYDDFLYTGTISSALPAETSPSAASRLDLGWALAASLCSMVAVALIA